MATFLYFKKLFQLLEKQSFCRLVPPLRLGLEAQATGLRVVDRMGRSGMILRVASVNPKMNVSTLGSNHPLVVIDMNEILFLIIVTSHHDTRHHRLDVLNHR